MVVAAAADMEAGVADTEVDGVVMAVDGVAIAVDGVDMADGADGANCILLMKDCIAVKVTEVYSCSIYESINIL